MGIGPNGKLTEISETPIHKDALEHENPMDVHFNSNDVEVFHPEDKPTESAVKATEAEKQEEEIASEPVMDVWAVEEEENKEPELKAGESVEFQPKSLPFLAVLRNTVEENERMSQQLLQRYRTLAEQEYRDDYTCNSDHLKWSDWVACLHARVGVPRWLTAATISLGIVFSVWLCLVIPSAAPKQRIRALVIKTEKPSAALAKAKEAEAASKACEAAGVDPKTVISVVRVDLPPSYGDVRPASPAPSYKSDMGVPASPAPSYRSVAPATKEEEAEEKVVLEPVHGEEEKKKESAAYLMPDLSHLDGILTFSFWMPFIIKHSQNVSKVWKPAILYYYFIPQNLLTGHILLKRSDMCISHGTRNCVCDMKELLEITKNNI